MNINRIFLICIAFIICITSTARTRAMYRIYALHAFALHASQASHVSYILHGNIFQTYGTKLPWNVLLEMFESTPLFKFHLHRKDIGENLTSDSSAGWARPIIFFVLTIVGRLCDHVVKKIHARTAMRSRNHDYNILAHFAIHWNARRVGPCGPF